MNNYLKYILIGSLLTTVTACSYKDDVDYIIDEFPFIEKDVTITHNLKTKKLTFQVEGELSKFFPQKCLLDKLEEKLIIKQKYIKDEKNEIIIADDFEKLKKFNLLFIKKHTIINASFTKKNDDQVSKKEEEKREKVIKELTDIYAYCLKKLI